VAVEEAAGEEEAEAVLEEEAAEASAAEAHQEAGDKAVISCLFKRFELFLKRRVLICQKVKKLF
jgi:hypothetical protein